MTESLFREDSYLKECAAVVLRTTATAIVLDRTVFYPMEAASLVIPALFAGKAAT